MDTTLTDVNEGPLTGCCVRTARGCSACLKFISMGKYSSKLYHKGASRHSSVIGGVLTIAFALVFIAYSITELISLFKRTNITVTEMQSHG
jgi:hypothetical protein